MFDLINSEFHFWKGLFYQGLFDLEDIFCKANVGFEDFSGEANLPGKMYWCSLGMIFVIIIFPIPCFILRQNDL